MTGVGGGTGCQAALVFLGSRCRVDLVGTCLGRGGGEGWVPFDTGLWGFSIDCIYYHNKYY